MKLIALRDIARVSALADVKIDNQQHERHIHKGAVFEFGNGEKLQDLGREDKAAAALLISTHAVGDANDPELVARVQAEVKQDQEREANRLKLDKQIREASLNAELASVTHRLAQLKGK